MLFINFLLAMLPIIWLMVALSVLKMPGFKACGIAAVVAMVLAAVYWHLPVGYVGAAALEGVGYETVSRALGMIEGPMPTGVCTRADAAAGRM